MIRSKIVSLKSNLAKSSHKNVVISNPHLPTRTQTDAVFDIVKRSVLKKAKKEGKKLSALQVRHEISELMAKWPRQNWPKLEKTSIKK